MVEAIRAGMLSQRHAIAVLRELDQVPTLSVEHRICISTIVLARLTGQQTPGELAKVTQRLILTIDIAAAEARREAATKRRSVRIWPTADGQAVFQVEAPLERIALIKNALFCWRADNPRDPEDPRSEAEREVDLVLALLTGGADAVPSSVVVVVPFSTTTGGELELAEVPGLGPVLPSVARQLLEDAEEWSQVAVDDEGAVIAVTDPKPMPASERQAPPDDEPEPDGPGGLPRQGPNWPGGPGSTGGWGDELPPWETPEPEPSYWPPMPEAYRLGPPNPVPVPRAPVDEQRREWFVDLLATPPPERLRPENLGSKAYRAPARLKRYLRARDRQCVFPGCTMLQVDVDHRVPYPLGPTDAANCQQLCRRHHRAKQRVFTVQLLPNGDYLWTTRGGWQFIRRRLPY